MKINIFINRLYFLSFRKLGFDLYEYAYSLLFLRLEEKSPPKENKLIFYDRYIYIIIYYVYYRSIIKLYN